MIYDPENKLKNTSIWNLMFYTNAVDPATRLPLQMRLFMTHTFYVLYAEKTDANVVIGKTYNTKQIYKFIFKTKFSVMTTMS